MDSAPPATTWPTRPSWRRVDESAVDLLFRDARTPRTWSDRAVPVSLLEEAWGMARLGPTSANCAPLRIVFVRTTESRDRLLPALTEGNRPSAEAAPVTAILGHDLGFWRKLDRLWPHAPLGPWFEANPALAETTAFRNATLQAGYFLLAARALGLDCGPVSGFDHAVVDREFFAGTEVRSNFLLHLGYAAPVPMASREPRLDFDEACRLV